MCFFVLLLSFSEMDVLKFKRLAGSMRNAFGVLQADHGIEISELEIAAESALAGRSIAECGAEHEAVVFIGLAHGAETMKINPRGDARLEPGDVLVAGGDAIAIGRLIRLSSAHSYRITRDPVRSPSP